MTLISLADWARREGIDPATARQKALRGTLKTARRIGRDWLIDESETNLDNRRKENKMKKYIVVVDGSERGGDAFGQQQEFDNLEEAIQEAFWYFTKHLVKGEREKTEVFVATDIINDEDKGIFEWRTLWSSKDLVEKVKKIRKMTIEEFYQMDEVTIESDGFYYFDPIFGEDNWVRVKTPEAAFSEDAPTDHLDPVYEEAWEELKDLAVKAYGI